VVAVRHTNSTRIKRLAELPKSKPSESAMGTFACIEQGIQTMMETAKSMIESHNGEFIEFTFQ